jgi:hypothetical protein
MCNHFLVPTGEEISGASLVSGAILDDAAGIGNVPPSL